MKKLSRCILIILVPVALAVFTGACKSPGKAVLKAAPPADWTAPDPTLDTIKRYRPVFSTKVKPEDYPAVLREGNLSQVSVYCTILIRADGRIQDVRVKRMRSRGNEHVPFRRVLTRMARDVVLTKTKLVSKPYYVDGKPSPFVWETRLDFAPR